MVLFNFKSEWLKLFAVLIFLGGSIVFGYTVEEIAELQKLGFTNQQIVDLQNKQPGNDASQVGSNQPPGGGSEINLKRLRELQDKGTGLLVICFSKDWIQKGPGYLYFDRKGPDGKWIPVGQAMLLDYARNGGFGPPKIETIRRVVKKHRHDEKHDDKHDKKNDKKDGKDERHEKEIVIEETIVHPRELITSRYYAEFELLPGKYDLKAERIFFTGDDENISLGKTRRHRKNDGVTITAGRVTILSYCWTANASFGLDYPLPPHHKSWLESVSGSFSPLVAETRF